MRVAFYGRVSSEEQAERGNIENQVEFAKKYFDLHGSGVGVTDYELYLDEGISGTIPFYERAAGARLIADVKAEKIKGVYVYRLDRLARSVKGFFDIYDLLESKNIALVSMTESFDTGTPTGKFFMTLLASIAALERDTILERTQLGKNRKAKEGKWVSGAPPFGYRIGEDGALTIYDPEAETVRLIYRLYEEDMTTVEIAKYLNARNIPTPAKSKGTKNKSTGLWHAGHISIILRTEAYIGEYTYLKRSKRKKETIPMKVPALVERKAFASVQTKLIENADVARGSRGRNYLLRGIIFCGHCGRAMVGSSGMSKEGRVYYRCNGTTDAGQGKRCNAKLIRAQAIEEAVWSDIQEFIMNPGKVMDLITAQAQQNKKDLVPIQKELAEVERIILDKQQARGKIISLCARSLISDAEAEQELASLAREIDTLTARRDFLFSNIQATQNQETEALTAQMALEKLVACLDGIKEEEKAKTIQALVKRVDVLTVDENGKRNSRAYIQYRFGPPEDCMDLSISADSQNKTTESIIKTAWMFHAFSRKGGERLGAQ